MKSIEFICPLPNGIHARPAKEIEQRAGQYLSEFTLVNCSKEKSANAKSVLSLISVDVLLDDRCCLQISGSDEEQAFDDFSRFIECELAGIDEALETSGEKAGAPLPVSLEMALADHLRGTVASSGIGAAKPLVLKNTDLLELADELESERDIDSRLADALGAVESELSEQVLACGDDSRAILEAHLTISRDPELKAALVKHHTARNAVEAIARACVDLCEPLEQSSSDYLKERALDIRDISLRLASKVSGRNLSQSPQIESDVVILSPSLLTPSQLLALPKQYIKGLVMGDGGTTSHTVILARSFQIPTLVGVEQLCERAAGVNSVLVDAINGVVLLESNPDTERYYALEQHRLSQLDARSAEYKTRQIETLDGCAVSVLANVVSDEEGEGALQGGADGIGLFRTELLFCERAQAPDEEEQLRHYQHLIRQCAGKKVVIRTLDIGGDKPCDYMGFPQEDNPFLGYRAIRMYPRYQAIFDSQLRALVRASAWGDVSVMVPMVANLDEICWCRENLDRVTTELQAEGYSTGVVKLGVMAEVPSVAYLLDAAKEYLDFISIGSNDLTQYFFACDRGNPSVAHLYDHFNPAFLAFVGDIIQRADDAGLEVSLCGEMAAAQLAQPLLLGAGLRQFSMSGGKVAEAKYALAQLSATDCRELFREALLLPSGAQVQTLVSRFLAGNQQCDTLDSSLIFTHQTLETKAQAIKLLSDNLELQGRAPSGCDVERAIWDREAVFSTALGFSVAVPHCKSDKVTHNSVSVMTLAKPIDWGEEVSVDLIIMLTVTEQGQDTHMQIFSKIARKLMHQAFRDSLKQAEQPDAVIDILNAVINA